MIQKDRIEKTPVKDVGLMIAVPTLGRPVPISWGFALASLRPPINYTVRTGWVWGKEVAFARNHLVEQAIKQNCKYIFFLGDDVVVPGHTLKQLIFQMEHNPDMGVCGAIYCTKSIERSPLVFRGNGLGAYWEWDIGELFEVTGIGMDATLIRVDVFKDMDGPWFVTENKDQYDEGIPKVEAWTEDLWFCDRLTKETPWKIYADGSLLCEHWQFMGGNQWQKFRLRGDSRPMDARDLVDKKTILDIGCGPVHWDFSQSDPDHEVVRVDFREDAYPDYRCDVRKLPFGNDCFDKIFSSHVLEHFARDETMDVLREWIRVLKPGGKFRLIVPTIEWAAEQVVAGNVDENVLNVFYGSQEYPLNFHKMGFTTKTLVRMLKTCRIVKIKAERDSGYNLIIEGTKRGAPKKPKVHTKKLTLKERRKGLEEMGKSLGDKGFVEKGKKKARKRRPLCCGQEMNKDGKRGGSQKWVCPKCGGRESDA